MFQLYPDQQAVYNATRGALRHHRRVLVQLPTGAGKTALAAAMTKAAADKGTCVFFLVHRVELIRQTALTFQKAGIEFGIISSQYPFRPGMNVYICGIDSLRRRLKNGNIPTPKLLFVDEAHHGMSKTWAATMDHYPNAYIVGLTATPHRLDGKGLSGQFDVMVRGLTVAELIEQDRLSDYDLYAPSTPDVTGVHKRAGDFAKGEIAEIMDTSKIIGNIVGNWRKYAGGKRTIGFAASIKHSLHMVDAFNQGGIAAAHLDGKSQERDRAQTAQDFADGKIQVLWNVDLFGEGYDLAAQAGRPVTVDAVIQARPTQSLSLHLQQVGRALRVKSDGSKAVILDHAGNAMRHGLPDDEREWNLHGAQKGDKSNSSEQDGVAIKQCSECFYVHRPAPQCPSCGHIYEITGRKIDEVEGELTKVDKEAMRKAAKSEQSKAQSLDALVELGMKRGYKNPVAWAGHIWTARQRKSA